MKNKKIIIFVVVVFAIVLGGFGFYNMFRENRVVSIVFLDVNPSIELKVNEDEDVVEANALNTEAEAVLEGMRLKGMDIDDGVNTIVGSLIKQGYLDELADSILVTVEDNNALRGERLQEELTEEIKEILRAASINAPILAQHVDMESSAKIADAYDISNGKAALIERILKVNQTYKEEELAQLSVNDLNLILSNPKNEVTDIVSTGEANEAGYIGREEAKTIALSHAGVTESEVTFLRIEQDQDDGRIEYSVDFTADNKEYDYEIDGYTGQILDYDIERIDWDS